MPYAREENLPAEAAEECERLALRSRFTLEELSEAARYIWGCGEGLETFRKVVNVCVSHGGSPLALAGMINDMAFEAGRAR
jgi:hypothetical protein